MIYSMSMPPFLIEKIFYRLLSSVHNLRQLEPSTGAIHDRCVSLEGLYTVCFYRKIDQTCAIALDA